MQTYRKDIAERFVMLVPHAKVLGLKLEDSDEDGLSISMPYDEKLIGDPDRRTLFGGVITTLMDTCGGAAVLAHPSSPLSTATLDLRIDYMRAATPEQSILAKASCYHFTRHVGFVRVSAYDDDRETPVAIATGAFTLDRGKSLI